MTPRTLLAGVLGAVAMFLWSAIAHMALPLGEAGIQQIENEQPLLNAMRSTLPNHGLYMFPKMASSTDQAANEKLLATGPSGLMVYFPQRDFSFGKLLLVEFLTQLVEALIAIYLLSLTNARTFGARFAFYAVLGLIAAIATNVSYANWYGFPLTYTSAYMLTVWVEFLCAGAVAAGMVRRLPGA